MIEEAGIAAGIIWQFLPVVLIILVCGYTIYRLLRGNDRYEDDGEETEEQTKYDRELEELRKRVIK